MDQIKKYSQFKSLPGVVRQKRAPVAKKEESRKRPRSSISDDFVGGSLYGSRRKSARIQGKVNTFSPKKCVTFFYKRK